MGTNDESSEKELLPGPNPVVPLTGTERFAGIEATVGDFWSWSASDLIDNATRGVLAEFLVAKAVGSDQSVRVNWDNYDVVSRGGVRIEVKSAGLLQGWAQRAHSVPRFGSLTGRSWDSEALTWSTERQVRADVFVFALQGCTEHDAYDPLDAGQWSFWVVPARAVQDSGSRSVGLGWVRQHGAGPLALDELSAAIDAAHNSAE